MAYSFPKTLLPSFLGSNTSLVLFLLTGHFALSHAVFFLGHSPKTLSPVHVFLSLWSPEFTGTENTVPAHRSFWSDNAHADCHRGLMGWSATLSASMYPLIWHLQVGSVRTGLKSQLHHIKWCDSSSRYSLGPLTSGEGTGKQNQARLFTPAPGDGIKVSLSIRL